MKRFPVCLLVLLMLTVVLISPPRATAAAPKAGRYKGTLTLRIVIEGTDAEVRKVIPVAAVAAVAAGTTLQLVLAEPLSVSSFESVTFFAELKDTQIVLRPNNDANPITLFDLKTSAGSIKAAVDLGAIITPTGSGAAHRFLALALTRIGN